MRVHLFYMQGVIFPEILQRITNGLFLNCWRIQHYVT